ncbi:MAG: redox-regulated ATPase YchF [Planctomycetes bacterium]|nr:redox-regulated ATPase YchF [Planctomycetota bacterium]
MSLSIGIIGLPNVGKSTLFNALTGAQNAAAESYPFCTIEPNKAIVPVPDERLEKIAKITNPEKVTQATVVFVDIAGLVENASQGEGLGNQFLSHVAESDALLHVVRCFSDENIAHVAPELNPVRDIETVQTELALRDIELVENRIETLERQARTDDSFEDQLETAKNLARHLSDGHLASDFPERSSETAAPLYREVPLVSDKKIIYLANTDEEVSDKTRPCVDALRSYADEHGTLALTIAAKFEEELIDMDDAEQSEFRNLYGIEERALQRVIRTGYETLDLVSFFTIQSNQAQAWNVPRGTPADRAAGTIHSDFEEGFIRAEVIAYDDLVTHGGEEKCRAAGVVRTVGHDYQVQDGDVIRFVFDA